MKMLVSIHDVMPSKLGRVEQIFGRLERAGVAPITLLIVPGTGWTEGDLSRLRALLARGGEIAGHGWCHEARSIRGFKHRLHSALISRSAAEHLALSRFGILRLMLRNYRWFVDRALPEPTLYVPPAWAMGPIPRELLEVLPFRLFETLAGVFDSHDRRFHRLPMAGFEADTTFRAATVGASNVLNRLAARASGRPLRLGIHPDDFELKLAGSLEAMVAKGGECIGYDSLSSSPA